MRARRRGSSPRTAKHPTPRTSTICSTSCMEYVPAPKGNVDAPLQAHVTNLDASAFLGRLALVRIHNGELRKGQTVSWMREVDGEPVVTKRQDHRAAHDRRCRACIPAEVAVAGDIVAVAGFPDIMIGDTLADLENPVALPRITVDQPAISVTIGTNTSPAGRPRQGPQAHRPHGQVPPRPGARRQRLAARSSTSVVPTPGRSRVVASWRWPSSSSRCAAKASS